jgi:hypothetical protein
LVPASAKAAADQELSHTEAKQFLFFHELRWRHCERIYYLRTNGVFSDQEWVAYRNGIAQSFTDTNANWQLKREAWEQNRAKLSANFVAYVDDLIQELE